MNDRHPRVIRFVNAELVKLSGDRSTALVELERRTGDSYRATAEGAGTDAGGLRCVAQAAAEALRRAVRASQPLSVDDVEMLQPFGRPSVVVAISVQCQDYSGSLVGISQADHDPVKATVRAVLNATNRVLGVG